jgi:hypothetical protein
MGMLATMGGQQCRGEKRLPTILLRTRYGSDRKGRHPNSTQNGTDDMHTGMDTHHTDQRQYEGTHTSDFHKETTRKTILKRIQELYRTGEAGP